MSSQSDDLAQFEAFCAELKTEDGSPFRLYEEQRTFLRDFFEGVIQTVIIVTKKNGKTTLTAALALYHLLVTPNAECIIVAAARQQAEIVLRQARMFIRSSPSLQRAMRVQQRSILSNLDEGRVYVLASDEDTADGVIPTLVIVDELHRHKTSELYGVLVGGLGPRNGQLICISTAGAIMDSPLGQKRSDAHALPTFRRTGKYNYARSETLAFHEYCLDPEDDTDDMAVAKLANPAPWRTEAALKEFQAMLTPWQWLRYGCGIWTEGEEGWLEPSQWDALCNPPESLADGDEVYIAVKVGAGAGIALASPREGGRVVVAGKVIAAPQQGRIPLEEVEWAIRQLTERYNVRKVLFLDPSFRRSAEILQAAGLHMVDAAQSSRRLVEATATLWRLISSGLLVHDGEKELRAQVLGGQTKEGLAGFQLVPNERTPVLIALAIASHEASALTEEKVYMVLP